MTDTPVPVETIAAGVLTATVARHVGRGWRRVCENARVRFDDRLIKRGGA